MGDSINAARRPAHVRAVSTILHLSFAVVRGIGRLVRRRFTVMVVPHTARRPVSFTIGFAGLLFITALLAAVTASSIWMIRDGLDRLDRVAERRQEFFEVQASIDSLRDEVQTLFASARSFDSILESAIASIPGHGAGVESAPYSGLASSTPSGTVESDVEILENLADLLSVAGKPLLETVEAIRNKESFIADIPTAWPVAGGRGTVTHEWGPNIHPFYGRWYMHTGIDIADGGANVPLVAAANGTVVETGNQEYGYGLYVEMEHRFGIRTKYAHLNRIDVRTGDELKQGDRIGVLGSTGLSTGPHVHFEIFVGNQNVDPASYLTISNQFNRRTTRRAR